MPENSEQVRPLPAASEIRPNRRIKCCVYLAVLLLIQFSVAATLAFTVFKLKSPTIQVEKLNFDNVELFNGSNMTLSADILLKNPNFASFKYENMTAAIFYRGEVIGESRAPPGRAKAHRTARINVTVDITRDRILSRPDLFADIYSGLVNVSGYARVGGKINLFNIGKHMTMKMNCNMSINVTSKTIQQHKCKRKIKL